MRRKILAFLMVFTLTTGNSAGVMAEEDDIFVDGSGLNVTDLEESDLDGTMDSVQNSDSETIAGHCLGVRSLKK